MLPILITLAPCSLAPCSLAPCSLAPCSLAPCSFCWQMPNGRPPATDRVRTLSVREVREVSVPLQQLLPPTPHSYSAHPFFVKAFQLRWEALPANYDGWTDNQKL